MKQLLLSLAFILFSSIIYAQIGIGTTSPDPSSILDIQSTTKGFLAPRINLSSVTNSSIDGANTNAAGLLIYNTNASVTGGSGIGYYYWDGSVWTAMKAAASGGSGAGWQLDGNNLNGLADDGTTFLGTTTYHSLYFKVQNTRIGRLHPNGGIALGLGASSSANQAFAIGENASAGNTSNYAYGKAANASGSDAYAIGASSISSQTDSYALGKSATASGTSSYAIGEASKASHSNSYALGAGADSRATGSFAIGNQSVSSSNNTMALGNQSSATSNNATAIGYQANASNQNAIAIGPATTSVDNSIILGNTTNTTTDSYAATKVGIGTSNPSAKLHVNGTLRYVDGNEGNGKVMTSDANGNASWQAPAAVTPGDVKHGFQSVDHNGWYLLNGRAISSLPANAQTAAASLGFTGNLPNATNRVLKARTGSETLGATTGSNSIILTQANLPNYNMTATTSTNGNHSHEYQDGGANDINVGVYGLFSSNTTLADNGDVTSTTASAGSHSHTVTVNSGGSGTAINSTPASIVTNVFVYLGL